ncbi:hypothetical protein HDU67_005829, partial [Dinochytrium kinnereticum]
MGGNEGPPSRSSPTRGLDGELEDTSGPVFIGIVELRPPSPVVSSSSTEAHDVEQPSDGQVPSNPVTMPTTSAVTDNEI